LGKWFLWAVFLSIEREHHFGPLFPAVIFTHKFWPDIGTFWAIFFTNTSGHPDVNVHSIAACSQWKLAQELNLLLTLVNHMVEAIVHENYEWKSNNSFNLIISGSCHCCQIEKRRSWCGEQRKRLPPSHPSKFRSEIGQARA
jgi:hypothetical protein